MQRARLIAMFARMGKGRKGATKGSAKSFRATSGPDVRAGAVLGKAGFSHPLAHGSAAGKTSSIMPGTSRPISIGGNGLPRKYTGIGSKPSKKYGTFGDRPPKWIPQTTVPSKSDKELMPYKRGTVNKAQLMPYHKGSTEKVQLFASKSRVAFSRFDKKYPLGTTAAQKKSIDATDKAASDAAGIGVKRRKAMYKKKSGARRWD